MDSAGTSTGEKVQILDRLIKLFGRYAPFVALLVIVGSGFIYYSRDQAEKQAKAQADLNKLFEQNFEQILKQSNTNFASILQRSESGQNLYTQLNEILSKQMANLTLVSATQQQFLQDSANYLQQKLERVNSDIELKRRLAEANVQLAQLSVERDKLVQDAKELVAQHEKDKQTLLKLPELQAENLRVTNDGNNLRQKLIELSRSVQRGESDGKARQLATTYLHTYQTDYLPNLLKDIFNPATPALRFASQLEGQLAPDINAALDALPEIGICVRANYTINNHPALLLAGAHDGSGLRTVVEVQFNDLNQARSVLAWSELTTFTMPFSDWFSSSVMLAAQPYALDGEDGPESVRTGIAIDTNAKISCTTLVGEFLANRRGTVGEQTYLKGQDLQFSAAATESGRFDPTSPVMRMIATAGPQGALVRRAVNLLQSDAISQITGFNQLARDVRDTIQGAVLATAARDRAALRKFTTLNDPAELVEPLLKMTSLELIPPPQAPASPQTTPTATGPQVPPTTQPIQVLVSFLARVPRVTSANGASPRSMILQLAPATAPATGLIITGIIPSTKATSD